MVLLSFLGPDGEVKIRPVKGQLDDIQVFLQRAKKQLSEVVIALEQTPPKPRTPSPVAMDTVPVAAAAPVPVLEPPQPPIFVKPLDSAEIREGEK